MMVRYNINFKVLLNLYELQFFQKLLIWMWPVDNLDRLRGSATIFMALSKDILYLFYIF